MREEKTVTNYRCNRCDATLTRTHYSEPKKPLEQGDDRGWLFMMEMVHIKVGTSKDSTRGATDREISMHLCPECADKFFDFVDNGREHEREPEGG